MWDSSTGRVPGNVEARRVQLPLLLVFDEVLHVLDVAPGYHDGVAAIYITAALLSRYLHSSISSSLPRELVQQVALTVYLSPVERRGGGGVSKLGGESLLPPALLRFIHNAAELETN